MQSRSLKQAENEQFVLISFCLFFRINELQINQRRIVSKFSKKISVNIITHPAPGFHRTRQSPWKRSPFGGQEEVCWAWRGQGTWWIARRGWADVNSKSASFYVDEGIGQIALIQNKDMQKGSYTSSFFSISRKSERSDIWTNDSDLSICST